MEQSPLPAMEHGSERPGESGEQSEVAGPRRTGPAGGEAPRHPSPCLFACPFGFGGEGEAALTAVTATSCRAGKGEVRSKTTRGAAGKDHGERTRTCAGRRATRRGPVRPQQRTSDRRSCPPAEALLALPRVLLEGVPSIPGEASQAPFDHLLSTWGRVA